MKLKLITTAVLLVLAPMQTRTDWNGISPLFSSRAEVSKRLGSSEEKCDCLFKTSAGTVFIDYAEGPCSGPLPGWNVPSGTVLRIRVTPTAPQAFDPSEVTGFIKTTEGVATTFYTDVKKGVRYVVQDNRLISTDYIPSSRDSKLRCTDFPSYDGGIREYEPFDTFGKKSEPDMFARLDNFAVELTNNPRMTGYVISYAGKVISERGNEISHESPQLSNQQTADPDKSCYRD